MPELTADRYAPRLDVLSARTLVLLERREERAVSDLVLVRHPRGISSYTYDVRWVVAGGVRHGVLKSAPANLPTTGNRDVLREASVIAALSSTGILVPEVLVTDDGHGPDEPPFFVTAHVVGANIDPFLDGDQPAPLAEIEGLIDQAVSQLVLLHGLSVPPSLARLMPRITLDDELRRWVRAMESVDESLVPGFVACAEQLARAIPTESRPCLTHGDMRLGNLISANGEVAAVIDWEMAALGDPRLDAAFLAVSCDPTHPFARITLGTRRTAGEILVQYLDARDLDRSHARWFLALARFKQCAEVALIIHRARRRSRVDRDVLFRERGLPLLLAAALANLEGNDR